MGFRNDAYAKVWKVEDKGKYSVCQVSISKKNKKTNEYETEFQSSFVRFVGEAHERILALGENSRIKILSCDVTNKYDKDKKVSYTNFVVYSCEDANSENGNTGKKLNSVSLKQAKEDALDIASDDLPF